MQKEDHSPYYRAVEEMVVLGRNAGLGASDLEAGYDQPRPEKGGMRFFVAYRRGWWYLFLFWVPRRHVVVQLVPEANVCEVHDSRWERIARRVLENEREFPALITVRVYRH